MKKILLREIAIARSGDKGSHVNIGVIVKKKELYPILIEKLTAERVKEHFFALYPTSVQRYLLPNLHSFNFVLYNILDGGGSRNLRIDAQGKALGQAILEMELLI